MHVVTAPKEHEGRGTRKGPRVFMAGGISNCPDWQSDFIGMLSDLEKGVLYNPRRPDFNVADPMAADKQIAWEHHHLRKADAISFWFPCETLCPITLYELGAWTMMKKPIFVGCHPAYKRLHDVVTQTLLARPKVKVVTKLEDLSEQVREWVRRK